jgi:hypothetical protein
LKLEFDEFSQETGLDDRRELFNDAFPEHGGSGPASLDHYDWKFHRSPATPSSYEYEAREGGQLLGYYAAIPYAYEIGGRAMRVGMVCDVMTSSAARGKGVFTQLGEYSLARLHESSLDFVTGYPIRPEVMGGHLRVGWKVAFELPMYLRPLKSNAILGSRGLRRLAPLANVAVGAYGALLAPRDARGRYLCETGTPQELVRRPEFSPFLARWSATVENHLVKTPEFYGWRLGAPGASYQAFHVRAGDDIVAAAIGRVATLQGIPSLALLDLMVLEGEQEALPALYAAIDRAAREAGVEAIVTMISRHQARRHRLVRFGFLRSPFAFKLIIRSVSDALEIESISGEAGWHLMWIDSDDL